MEMGLSRHIVWTGDPLERGCPYALIASAVKELVIPCITWFPIPFHECHVIFCRWNVDYSSCFFFYLGPVWQTLNPEPEGEAYSFFHRSCYSVLPAWKKKKVWRVLFLPQEPSIRTPCNLLGCFRCVRTDVGIDLKAIMFLFNCLVMGRSRCF